DLLGEHQDSLVASAWLRELALSPAVSLTPLTLLYMGALQESHHRWAAQRREAWPASWRQVQTRWRPLRRAMQRDQALLHTADLALDEDLEEEPPPAEHSFFSRWLRPRESAPQ